MSQSDEQCIRMCLDGETEMFRWLVLRYEAKLIRHLRRQVGPHEELIDTAQESFVRAFSNLHTLEKRTSFYPWLVGIANRIVLEGRRKRSVYQCERSNLTDVVNEICQSAEIETFEFDPKLTQAIDSLPIQLREVILLRFYGDRSCSDIASMLQVSVGTITSRLSRAYKSLRETLSSSEAK